ncbi:MAG TPA: tetratricopeptide repeat protein [Planctomycetota bacterium]
MAIEKIEKKKVEFTRASVAQLGVSAALVIGSLVMGYLSFANWRFKSSLSEAYRAYDVGNVGQAAPLLRDALSWRPEHPGARQLLAKIETEAGSFDQAESHYQKLRAQNQNDAPVRIGLGVLHLRRAERAEDEKVVKDLVGKAREEFRQAGEAPEGEIGLGHCELLLAWKLKDEKALATAKTIFEKVRKTLDGDAKARARITREGLVDYYAGLGKVLTSSPGYDPAASAAWKACGQYARRWTAPQAAYLYMEARRFDAWKDGLDGLQNIRVEAQRLRNDTSNLFKSIPREQGAALQEAWIVYTLSLGAAWARNGNVNEHTQLLGDFKNPGTGLNDRLEPFLLDAVVKTEVATTDIPNMALQDGHMRSAITAYTDLEKRLTGTDDLTKSRKALALNNLGWMEAWRGSYTNNKGLLNSAVRRFQEASKLDPGEYVFYRNTLVVQRRLLAPLAQTAPVLEQAKAKGVGTWAKDFEELQKHLESK